jgi:hypothetical protein
MFDVGSHASPILHPKYEYDRQDNTKWIRMTNRL